MMRGGTNYLRIERGRWKGEKREERVCNVCLCEVVEDEKHFLLECPMYARERDKMFVQIRERCQLEYVEMMNQDRQLEIMIGTGLREKGKQIREIVLEYLKKANEIRNKYIL